MKKILIIFLLLFCINVKADEVNIDKIDSNYEDYMYIEVTSNDNLDKLSKFVNAKEILFKNVNITDTSVLNNMGILDKVTIYYSKVDLKKFSNKHVTNLDIISSYVINSDFSSLQDLNIKKLNLGGSYIENISTLKNTSSIETLNLSFISNLKSLDVITKLPNLRKLDIVGSEDLVNDKVLNYIKEKSITGTNYDRDKYDYLKVDYDLDGIIESLNLDGLSDMEKITKITQYVVKNIEYDDDCNTSKGCHNKEFSFNAIKKSLSKMGICYHFAILNNELLNRVGIKSYLVSGYTKKGLGHEWLNVYLDGKWYSIDPTFIKTYIGDESRFLQTGKSMFFMAEITDNDSFLKDHVIDVYAKDVVNVFEVAKDVSLDTVIYDNSNDDYDLIFDIALISLSVCAIIVVCKITKK